MSTPRTHPVSSPLDSDDEAAIVAKLRTLHKADLREIETGERGSALTQRLAMRAVRLRADGTRLARATLASLGCTYTGTGGWWIGAYATPDAHLGYVNIAQGIAVRTDVALSPEILDALTVPDQPTGPQSSGAAAWVQPDPGGAHRTSAPEGWVQLAVDLRGGESGDLGRETSAHIVAWGLQTCYGRAGEPGWLTLDPLSDERRMDAQEWPLPADLRAEMHRVGREAMEAAARDLELLSPQTERAIVAPRAYTAADAALSVARHAARRALNVAGWTELAYACGDTGTVGTRRLDRLQKLIEADVLARVTPVAEVLAAQVTGAVVGDDETPLRSQWRILHDMLTPVAEQIACNVSLTPIRGRTRVANVAMQEVFAAAAPLVVSINTPSPRSPRQP